ncbi:MAG: AAA family ATPase [Clostridium tyrobutyricum]|jgi:energy-coupling factor transporter ATP-binding protein EcfA2|uniref:Spaf_1101 family AAA-like ATPase n=1 Tax=Clostridium tyrobutyricum TaxID=1519 RepID=UPI0011C76A84|nr:AAA family ATPase [Clostridium tyrobutyricum]MCH4260123.1 AAA family ATPase [Clostridium tyrobutyricum]MCI2011767.1 AAA family ATPase [Clostridium tyrobutyricum]
MNTENKALSDAITAYNKISNLKEKFGVFYKSVFHIHTPASHDFKLLYKFKDNDKKYKLLSDIDIYKLCIRNHVFFNVPIETFNDSKFSIYKDRKECLSYLLYANQIINNNISIVVVTDHNTIDGYDKLVAAIDKLSYFKKGAMYPEVILGIEISCADKNHIVGIFDNSTLLKEGINNWLNEVLLNEEEGSYLTSIDVLSKINELGGIGYIAHINSSYMFKEKKYLSGAFKNKLFNLPFLNIIGITDKEQKPIIESKILNYTNRKMNYVIDNDAHSIEELKHKYFWIKGSKRKFHMLREALSDYNISVSFNAPILPNTYIKGIFIENNNDAFLTGKNSEGFCLNFSEALNCLIGGRGTGKSTILQILEFALNQNCTGVQSLDFLCKHGPIWILYVYKQQEYLIKLNLPHKVRDDENILRYFGQNPENKYHYTYHFNSAEISKYIRNKCLDINKVILKYNVLYLESVKNKTSMLNEFFDTRYSVNELVQTASGDEINKFIFNTMFKNKTLSKPGNIIRVRSKSGLNSLLESVEEFLLKRKEEVSKVIDPFNDNQKGILRIIYSQSGQAEKMDYENLIFGKSINKKEYFNKWNITNENIIDYVFALDDKMGVRDLLLYAFNGKYKDMNKKIPIKGFQNPLTNDLIDMGIKQMTSEDEIRLIEIILKKLTTNKNIKKIIRYLKTYVSEIESFSLEFNLNNKESNEVRNPLYKDIRILSLGQKVVAMLSFILGYSEYSEDFRPLLIDQPEDNLDNRYIYKNLVHQLKAIKAKRQVIIATHNATIVTNAKADQVVVMESDNKHGWIRTTGYPAEDSIKIQIINHLEGGMDSFKHKYSIYKDVLWEKRNKRRFD